MTTKIFVATPMYGGRPTVNYVHSLMLLQRWCHENHLDMTWRFLTNESLITRGRNTLAAAFLESDCTHYVSIDADIEFSPADVIKLLESGKDFVCGLYPLKMIDWHRVRDHVMSGKDISRLSTDVSPSVCNLIGTLPSGTDLAEIYECGTGFQCLSRSVFETMIPHVGKYQGNRPGELSHWYHEFYSTAIDPSNNTLMSEDYYFCQLWRRLGGRIYARLDINLRHIGDYAFSNITKYVMDPDDHQ